MRKFLLLSSIAFAAIGCSKYYYNPAPQVLPQHIRKVAVRSFTNETKQYRLEDRLMLALNTAFQQDGRFEIVPEEQADGVVIGNITRYMLMPMAHDANQVPTEYKLWILIDVTFYDKIRNLTLWTERNMEGKVVYPAASTGQAGSMTDVEAQQRIWDQMAKDIAVRTFEGFGSVTGASDKGVPKSSPEQNSLPSAPPDTSSVH